MPLLLIEKVDDDPDMNSSSYDNNLMLEETYFPTNLTRNMIIGKKMSRRVHIFTHLHRSRKTQSLLSGSWLSWCLGLWKMPLCVVIVHNN